MSLDGCSSTCQTEAGFTCKGYGVGSCTEDCDGTWSGFLTCDGGGCCNGACTALVAGVTFSKNGGCKEICGSGLMLGITPKNCEDGSARADDEYYGDGCDNKCNVEVGFTCPAIGKCTEDCGATSFDFWNYACDDGNNVNGDGCSSACAIEYGYECHGGDPLRNDVCYEICGDGKDLGYWWCDDGNNEAGDGCDAWCHIERGYSCTGGTSVKADTCTEICGDGVDHLYY